MFWRNSERKEELSLKQYGVHRMLTINVPFLVIAGDHDLINLDHTVSLFTNLPKSQLYIVPHASHLAAIENPELINSAIIRFLNEPYTAIDRYYFVK
ncbi:MAG: hypothetical protein GX876_08300 [Bacteroidales bacterium]|nr:hypothetical protein [Bacteroidales bacterium]